MTDRVKFDWYQTESDVVVTVLRRGVTLDQCRVNFEQSALTVGVQTSDDSVTELVNVQLSHPIDAKKCSYKCTPAKIEVKLRKLNEGRWETLEAKAESELTPKEKKNWDKLEKQVIEDEEEAELEGDAAVNRLFQKIYKDADDDVKKAMIKSYSESGGTVLSTNWNEIQKEKTDIKPPDGMEWKKYD